MLLKVHFEMLMKLFGTHGNLGFVLQGIGNQKYKSPPRKQLSITGFVSSLVNKQFASLTLFYICFPNSGSRLQKSHVLSFLVRRVILLGMLVDSNR